MISIVLHMVCGKRSGEVGVGFEEMCGKDESKTVIHKVGELFTKLSTRFYTRVAEYFPRIHRLYYHNYFNLN